MARVRVAASANTMGPHSGIPHNRPPSRLHNASASRKYAEARSGSTCEVAGKAHPSAIRTAPRGDTALLRKRPSDPAVGRSAQFHRPAPRPGSPSRATVPQESLPGSAPAILPSSCQATPEPSPTRRRLVPSIEMLLRLASRLLFGIAEIATRVVDDDSHREARRILIAILERGPRRPDGGPANCRSGPTSSDRGPRPRGDPAVPPLETSKAGRARKKI